MSEELKTAPAEELNNTEAVESQEGNQEATVGEILNTEQKEAPKEESVPLATFLEIKKQNKELAKEMRDLKKSIEEGASKREVASDIKSLSDKHNVDAEFLQDFADAIRSESKKELEEELASKLKPLTEKERAQKIDSAFNEHFQKALEKAPEYEGVVNKDIIKALSLNPANKNKTFNQLIDEAYGHLVQGRRTMEVSSPRTGKNDEGSLDVDRARSDSTYFKEVMGNPELKKKYNDEMLRRLRTMP